MCTEVKINRMFARLWQEATRAKPSPPSRSEGIYITIKVNNSDSFRHTLETYLQMKGQLISLWPPHLTETTVHHWKLSQFFFLKTSVCFNGLGWKLTFEVFLLVLFCFCFLTVLGQSHDSCLEIFIYIYIYISFNIYVILYYKINIILHYMCIIYLY